jgi:hypothetical protein
MPAACESLVTLEQRLVDTLLHFEKLSEAWPKAPGAVERAGIGRRRESSAGLPPSRYCGEDVEVVSSQGRGFPGFKNVRGPIILSKKQ